MVSDPLVPDSVPVDSRDPVAATDLEDLVDHHLLDLEEEASTLDDSKDLQVGTDLVDSAQEDLVDLPVTELPDSKDRLVKDLVDSKDRLVKDLVDSKDRLVKDLVEEVSTPEAMDQDKESEVQAGSELDSDQVDRSALASVGLDSIPTDVEQNRYLIPETDC